MKKMFVLSTALLLAAGTLFAAPAKQPEQTKFDFVRLNLGNNGEATFKKTSANSFEMTLRNTTNSNHSVACASFNLKADEDYVLSFKITGKKTNGRAFVTPFVLHVVKTKWITADGPALACSNEKAQEYKLSFKKDFKLTGKTIAVSQVKFVLNTNPNPKNSKSDIVISDIKIAPAGK